MKLNKTHLIVMVLLATLLLWTPTKATSNTLIITRFVYRDIMEPYTPRGEYVVIKNISDGPINLVNYRIGDEEAQGGTEGMYFLPDYTLTPGTSVIIAADQDSWNYPTSPDLYISTLTPDTTWGSGGFSLSNLGDQVVLIDNIGNLVDGACYGNVTCTFSGTVQVAILDTALVMDVNQPGYKRNSDTDTDRAVDWQTNPTAIRVTSLEVRNRASRLWIPGLVVLGILYAASLLFHMRISRRI
jgi:hypothetical protein